VSPSTFELGALTGALPALLVLVWVLVTRRRVSAAHRAAFEQAADSVLLIDALTLEIVDASHALLRRVGHTGSSIRGLPLSRLLEDSSGEPGTLLRRLRDPRVQLPAQARQRSQDGGLRKVEVNGHRVEVDGRQLLALTVSDVLSCGAASPGSRQPALDHLAHHDLLTGLPNRRFLCAHLPGAVEHARRAGRQLAVLFLDLDHFNHVNDARGHETGDKLLQTLAERIRATVPADDLVVRMGSDEFVIIVKSVQSPEAVNAIAARIKEALAVPAALDGRVFTTTASIGLCLYPRDGSGMSELLRNADTARYQAKAQGRNTCQVFSPAMGRQLAERIALESCLRMALQRRQLEVHYQPIVDIHSHRLVALECLLRWKHPVHGFISPDRFIPIAEETGLIVPIGEMVLERVIEDMACWEAAGCTLAPVAVNISAVQLQRSDLAATVARLTLEHGVSPRMLQVELTESAALDREDALVRLRELGVAIAIDDFGMGYSSLGYLKRCRADYLKIDRSFVRELVSDACDLAIVSAIIAMAQRLDIKVVAEGIETRAQLQKLQELGSQFAQGFLFARPVPAEQCRRYLTGAPLQPGPDPAAVAAEPPAAAGAAPIGDFGMLQPLPFGL
jgi:diguanylate cyclase (GGDEF)-like protein/PAS domain S-box-containing protein